MGSENFVSKKALREIKAMQAYVEENAMAQATAGGNSERRTRQGYKDNQKSKVFSWFAAVADRMQLPDNVTQRAKALFSVSPAAPSPPPLPPPPPLSSSLNLSSNNLIPPPPPPPSLSPRCTVTPRST